ncbi:hypothetical protein GCM10010195_50240 [Kitasatospora griseola]|nr:hypothetical protein GCM10010195_50240 [Kitasatospora griseola]
MDRCARRTDGGPWGTRAKDMSADAEAARIVAGVDGSPASRTAPARAVRQAELTGARVETVIAWRYPAGYGRLAPVLGRSTRGRWELPGRSGTRFPYPPGRRRPEVEARMSTDDRDRARHRALAPMRVRTQAPGAPQRRPSPETHCGSEPTAPLASSVPGLPLGLPRRPGGPRCWAGPACPSPRTSRPASPPTR